MADKRPNILMIFSDEHNPRYMGCMGHPLVETPCLDKFSKQSVTFENAYCNSPLCSPSRQSFMTGLYPLDIGVWNNTCSMPENSVTWAHLLSQSGYDTQLLGRMHFNGYQKMYGFDKRPVLETDDYDNSFYSWGIRTSHKWDDPLPTDLKGPPPDPRSDRMTAGPDTSERHPRFQNEFRILEGTLNALKEKASNNEDEPWAICSAFLFPHEPLKAREDLFKKYEGKGDLPRNYKGENLNTADEYLQHYLGSFKNYPEEIIRRCRETYFALVTEMDEMAGQLLDCLEETGLAENTVVVYLTDHGEMAGERGIWGKCSLAEASSRVPLMVRWPEVSKPGLRVDKPVSLIDLFPTFLDIAEVDLPAPLTCRGNTLRPLLENRQEEFKGGPVFCEYENGGWNHPRAFLRDGKYKFIINHTAEELLYNLEEDPWEENNLLGKETLRDIENYLRSELTKFGIQSK